jgi:hypothetical protein
LSLLFQPPIVDVVCVLYLVSCYADMCILLDSVAATIKVDGTALCRELSMDHTMDTMMVGTMDTKEAIDKAPTVVTCLGVMGTSMTSLVVWAGMEGMAGLTTSTADMEEYEGHGYSAYDDFGGEYVGYDDYGPFGGYAGNGGYSYY